MTLCGAQQYSESLVKHIFFFFFFFFFFFHLRGLCIILYIIGRYRGGSGGSLEPPLGPNYFNFMGKSKKNQVK